MTAGQPPDNPWAPQAPRTTSWVPTAWAPPTKQRMNTATRVFAWMTPLCVVLAGLLLVGALSDGGRSTNGGAFVPAAATPNGGTGAGNGGTGAGNGATKAPWSDPGTPVYSVEFASRPDDWHFDDDADSTSGYDAGGLRFSVLHGWTFTWPSPYDGEVDSLHQSATARLGTGTPFDARVGVGCIRDWGGAHELDYAFTVDQDGGWVVDRTDDANASDASPRILSSGAVVQRTTGPLRVAATCTSVEDHRSVRLQLTINGVTATNLTDRTPASSHAFTGALVTYGSRVSPDVASVFDVSEYSESDLG